MAKEFTQEELLVLSEEIIEVGKKKTKYNYKVRLISWGGNPPVLEKRQLLYNEDMEEWYAMKGLGFNKKDLELIFSRKDEILQKIEEYNNA